MGYSITEETYTGSAVPIQFGGENDYSEFEQDGTLTMVGDATVWNDLVMPLTSGKRGSNDRPDFDYTNIGYLFPQNDTAEALYLIAQFPHSYKVGSAIYPHIHYKRTVAGKPTFKIVYAWTSIGEEVPVFSAPLSLDHEVVDYVSGSIHQVNNSTDPIDGTGQGLSSIMLIKLYRDDNDVAGDVLAYQFDVHFEIDTIGSREEFTK